MSEKDSMYRCTRRYPYADPGCPGYADPSARQGYYLMGKDEEAVKERMAKKFPEDVENGFDFDVKLWKE